MRELMNNEEMAAICRNGNGVLDAGDSENGTFHKIEEKEASAENTSNGTVSKENHREIHQKLNDERLRISFANVAAREIKNVNENYFGAYGSFGIHREMISDKIRTDVYRDAILCNPSLLKQATVLDVGCGTGILSLFAAQARVQGSLQLKQVQRWLQWLLRLRKITALYQKGVKEEKKNTVLEQSMWCRLWLKILTNVYKFSLIALMCKSFSAGFGKGGTSLPFWENVYGFNMSCIGKEVDPIVDVVDSRDIGTESAALKFFDLATMRPDDIDFTATSELELKSNPQGSTAVEKTSSCWCHGIALWFDTGFTNRFCKETPVVLSTSPYNQRTHWSQTIFTFQEPIAMASANCISDAAGALGTEDCPVGRIR